MIASYPRWSHSNNHKQTCEKEQWEQYYFDITTACDDALKQELLAAFHNDYLEGLANANIGFATTTTLELINHIYNSYETISPS